MSPAAERVMARADALAARLQLTPRLLQVLTQYVYRGNVGELKNVVKYAVASAWARSPGSEMLTVTLHDLQLAWLKIARQSRLKRNHTIQREELSVREHMTLILRKLSDDTFVVFETLFDHTLGPAGLVVSFLATLELVKERLVVVTQNEAFAPIYVKRADAAAGFD